VEKVLGLMNKLMEKVMPSDKLDRFVRVCIKLDELRFKNTVNWGELGINIHKNPRLTFSERILLFWLCSMIDQFYSYKKVWTDGEEAMLAILRENPSSFSNAEKIMFNFRKDKIGNEMADVLTSKGSFKLVRDDYLRIKNTFNFLSELNVDKNLSFRFVKLLGNAILNFKGKNGILKLANFLNDSLWENTLIKSPSDQDLEKFRKKQRKRLWMFIMFLKRDPSILKIFRNALIEVYGKDYGEKLFSIWTNEKCFNKNEIELPSDTWNKRLFEKMRIQENPKEFARKCAQEYGISPSVFDVTFEIGANRCRSMECEYCPFGENKLCHKGGEKYCPITGWLFLYTKEPQITCQLQDCPIGKDLGKGLCKGKI